VATLEQLPLEEDEEWLPLLQLLLLRLGVESPLLEAFDS